MDKNQQQIAIAEACGWTRMEIQEAPVHWRDHPIISHKWIRPNVDSDSEPPDYLNDLNAMHEAEEILTDHTGYWQWIERLQGGPPLKFTLLRAKADVRAEAFLRTIDRWEEQ